jgi:hypothetical protein
MDFFIGGIGGVFIMAAVLIHSVQAKDPLALSSVAEQRATFEQDIRTLGGAGAYTKFKKIYSEVPFNQQHLATHIFGGALYTVLAHDGVAVCDSGFSFGCFHGFFIGAVSEEGLSVVKSLDIACSRTPIPAACQHGIGHGILEYLGHGRLDDALRACAEITRSGPVGGCTSGVFMEYNVPLIESSGAFSTEARMLPAPDEPYHPCPEVASQFSESCYHELPQWWEQVYAGDFGVIGRLCHEAGAEEYQRACVGGIGYRAAPSANYNLGKTRALCAMMPTDDMEHLCIVSASHAFASNIGDDQGAMALCDALPVSYLAACSAR